MANIQDFKSQLIGGGARPNLFKVTLPFPTFAAGAGETRQLSFLAKGAQLPASTIGVINVPYRGRQLKVAGDRIFPEWTITVINDTSFAVRDAFEKWMNGINEHQNNVGLDIVEYQVDAKVEQLGRNNDVLSAYDFKSIFPTELSTVELSFETNDTLEEYSVTFQVNWWEKTGVTS